MRPIYDVLVDRLRAAFDVLAPGSDPVVRPSDHADYQANGVMAVAKALGRNPRDVAAELVSHLDLAGVADVEIAGPGFLNIRLTDQLVSEYALALAHDPRAGVAVGDPSRTVVVDYSAPNVAKEMHVGHLRSTIIGDALARVHGFLGHRVIRRNHVGDWGTPFGMLIEHLLDLGEDEAVASLSIGDLDSFYREARAKFDASDDFKERSRTRVVALQSGDAETRRLWQILVTESVTYFTEVYQKLDVTLSPDDVVGESSYNDRLNDVVADLTAKGLLRLSDGAWCAFPEGFANRDGEPQPLIVQKGDGGFGYAATDLAAIRTRVGDLHADDILYVVGSPQAQHFAMVFAVAREAGWLPATVHAEHINFGSVLGSDHKMLKSREGGAVKLVALLDEATDRADESLRTRQLDLPEDERRHLATQIARAAIKYADLSTERQRDYVLDFDRMLAFEGDTGPYLLYANARIQSVFRRLGELPPLPATLLLDEPSARALAVTLMRFPEAVAAMVEGSAPHKLCTYLFSLAQDFTAFYDACPIVASEGDVQASRVALCVATTTALRTGLSLLGIDAPERM